jgi:hypothetical protein
MREGRASFLEKRSKKLLSVWVLRERAQGSHSFDGFALCRARAAELLEPDHFFVIPPQSIRRRNASADVFCFFFQKKKRLLFIPLATSDRMRRHRFGSGVRCRFG